MWYTKQPTTVLSCNLGNESAREQLKIMDLSEACLGHLEKIQYDI